MSCFLPHTFNYFYWHIYLSHTLIPCVYHLYLFPAYFLFLFFHTIIRYNLLLISFYIHARNHFHFSPLWSSFRFLSLSLSHSLSLPYIARLFSYVLVAIASSGFPLLMGTLQTTSLSTRLFQHISSTLSWTTCTATPTVACRSCQKSPRAKLSKSVRDKERDRVRGRGSAWVKFAQRAKTLWSLRKRRS